MILEHAVLPIRPGQEIDFERAFATARPLIEYQPGCRSVTLRRSIETPSAYLLLVEWDSVEAHTQGFRRSREYERWRELLNPFSTPFPAVEHFVDVATEGPEIRPLTAAEIGSAPFLALLWEAAGVETEALRRIRDDELPSLRVIGAVPSEVSGFAAFDERDGYLELHYIAVADTARADGLGSRLVDAARHSAPHLELHAGTDDDAVGFYRRLGFAIAPAPRDPRWPERPRYTCTIAPLDTSSAPDAPRPLPQL
ncbi:GNAT family N-acetyltransferase [Microbacterium dextranolyticum]|uniref:Antibiotic biosynthesis monooxygenase n=1 Tax=Microbacterium dextranolyticum TaxID=36806 RepID=A0A9W6M556_9MICO|nr:GNAT family N-acetyltransferase [Microbacterium dextranolyticum]MBM7463927.1 heme-degrading monooxygenase HmoA/N-acetylglutamate synthase-like GNAT family acetyltransferase [Microbacterium dextranolyticum]GLJ95009.1 hypothetical protein GCM10017591_10710 [Microbacterium dextranolyticum]